MGQPVAEDADSLKEIVAMNSRSLELIVSSHGVKLSIGQGTIPNDFAITMDDGALLDGALLVAERERNMSTIFALKEKVDSGTCLRRQVELFVTFPCSFSCDTVGGGKGV